MKHTDSLRSSNASISKEDWERVFGPRVEPVRVEYSVARQPGKKFLPMIHRSSP